MLFFVISYLSSAFKSVSIKVSENLMFVFFFKYLNLLNLFKLVHMYCEYIVIATLIKAQLKEILNLFNNVKFLKSVKK